MGGPQDASDGFLKANVCLMFYCSYWPVPLSLTFFDTVIFVILGEASADILGLCPPLDEADLWEGEMLQFSPPLMVRKFRVRVRGVLAI